MLATATRRLLLAVVLTCGPFGVTHAAEQEPATVQAAQRHFESGVTFYQAGDYESARIEFEAGFRLSKLPDFLVNLCKVAEKQNRPEDAVRYCEQYQRLRPDDEDVRQQLERLRSGTAEAASPAPAPSPPAQTVSGAQVPSDTAMPTVPSKSRKPVPKPALGLLIGGSALLVAGIGTGGAALAAQRETEASPLFDDLDALQRRGKALNVAAISLSVVGGAAAIAGAGCIGYWLHGNNRPAAIRSGGDMP